MLGGGGSVSSSAVSSKFILRLWAGEDKPPLRDERGFKEVQKYWKKPFSHI